MHVPQDLMWWKIWKILQKFLETKQGLKDFCTWVMQRMFVYDYNVEE